MKTIINKITLDSANLILQNKPNTFSDVEKYWIINEALAIAIFYELYELCSELTTYLATDEMIYVKNNSDSLFEEWNKTKKLF